MTSAGWVHDLIEDEWGTGPNEPPEKPEVIKEGEVNRRSAHTKKNDVIFTKDGGRPTVQPQSIGYREEYVEATIDVEIITSGGREHLLGPADETYAGLEGEVRRIVEKYRIGYPHDGELVDPGYDIIRIDTFDDEIGSWGADFWAGTWTITFITYAKQIPQEPANRA